MAVRKRRWHTRAQAQVLAKQAGIKFEDARQRLVQALSKDALPADAKLLNQYPPQEAWIVEYSVNGSRHLKTFERKKDADVYYAQVSVDVGKGVHVAPSKSITVVEAGELWIKACEAEGEELERATVDGYKQHLRLHINPRLGNYKLSTLTVPLVRKFKDDLRDDGRSPTLVKAVMGSLGLLLADALERGLVATNVVRSMKRERRKRRSKSQQKQKLKVGIDIPAPDEIKRLIAHLPDKYRPLLLTAIFTGLRASELRGLRWEDVDLPHARLHVCQRADRYNKIDKPKSEAGERTVPLPPTVVNTLREWKLRCPKGGHGKLEFVFPTGTGEIEYHSNILQRGLEPPQIAAGVVDKDGKPKYALHALRHFYASWCINRVEDGGLGLPLKMVQERLGHATLAMTADRYGHLFPKGDDGTELAKAEKLFFA
jgi:integrase